ncbi:MAG TPA: drug/metabolite exporter YedA [Thermoanaerobaculia bacterium]|nr:drug/metabolite exporter YedA [Thermoanaerobaculia bacterium]
MSPTGSSPAPSTLRVALALATVYVIWGSTYLAIAIAIETLPPFWMAGVRFVVAGALLYGFSRWRGAPRPTLPHWRSAALIGGLLLLGGNGGVVWAEQRVSSGIAALLVSMVPLWMVLFRWMQPGGERPTKQVWAGVTLGFTGLMLLVRPWSSGGGVDKIDLLGVAALMFACISWAWGSIHSRRVPLPDSPFLVTGMEMLCGGAMLLLVGAFAGEPAQLDFAAVSARSALALLYLITFGALAGFTAYIWLLKVANPVLVSTYAYVNPIVAVFLGWLILGEPITGKTLLAAAVIVAGVVMITLAQGKSGGPKAKPEPVPALEEETEEAEVPALAKA